MFYKESSGQSALMKQKRKEGYYVVKINSTSENGFMDLFCLKLGEPVLLIECKRDGEKRTASQKLVAEKLTAQGAIVKVMNVSGPVAIEIFDDPIAVLDDIGF
jgi:Holliday junction resolvase